MSDRGTSEAEQVKLGLAENDGHPWEWGTYIERNDGYDDQDDWTPIVYGGSPMRTPVGSCVSTASWSRKSPACTAISGSCGGPYRRGRCGTMNASLSLERG